MYEAGVFGARPERLPLSIGDPTLVTGRRPRSRRMFELFAFYLQAGLIDVAFLGGAQIDRFGNLNTTVIGDYESPKVRLPGSGGACEIAIHARRILVIMRQAQALVRRAARLPNLARALGRPAHDRARGWFGSGPTSVVTDLATYGFDEATGRDDACSRSTRASRSTTSARTWGGSRASPTSLGETPAADRGRAAR